MKFMGKTFVCALALAAATAVGCSSAHTTGTSGSTTQPGSRVGEVALNLTLQGGQTLTSLSYTLSNGVPADGQTGNIPLPTGNTGAGPFVVPVFEIDPVVAATGYTIALTGTSTGTGPVLTCTGTSGTFSVTTNVNTVVNVLVTCTTPFTAGSIGVDP